MEQAPLIASMIGTVISLFLGIMGIAAVPWVERFISVKAVGKTGESEIRATYGGFFFGISFFCLMLRSDLAFAALACGWLGAATMRFVNLYGSGEDLNKILKAAVFELVVGAMIIAKPISELIPLYLWS